MTDKSFKLENVDWDPRMGITGMVPSVEAQSIIYHNLDRELVIYFDASVPDEQILSIKMQLSELLHRRGSGQFEIPVLSNENEQVDPHHSEVGLVSISQISELAVKAVEALLMPMRQKQIRRSSARGKTGASPREYTASLKDLDGLESMANRDPVNAMTALSAYIQYKNPDQSYLFEVFVHNIVFSGKRGAKLSWDDVCRLNDGEVFENLFPDNGIQHPMSEEAFKELAGEYGFNYKYVYLYYVLMCGKEG